MNIPMDRAPITGGPMVGKYKCEFKQIMTPLLYASIDSNPHPLESLDRDDSELETRYGLKSENCVENTNYALKVWKSAEKSNQN